MNISKEQWEAAARAYNAEWRRLTPSPGLLYSNMQVGLEPDAIPIYPPPANRHEAALRAAIAAIILALVMP